MSTSAPVPGRWIDPRGHRFDAFLSAMVLIGAIAVDAPLVVALVGLALGVSALFGTQWSAFGRPWPFIRRLLRLGPVAPEHDYPSRFAQALGSSFLFIGLLLLMAGTRPWGWLPVASVIALQLLLAATGYCLGCRLYFVRWYLPQLFARAIARGTEREPLLRAGKR
ncbi:MAG: DUF4395 domain-containing protein [Chloroflexi bacterium]|nr:MAG: DUF4395 domain-containing protein [Chloroflexota bacterium]